MYFLAWEDTGPVAFQVDTVNNGIRQTGKNYLRILIFYLLEKISKISGSDERVRNTGMKTKRKISSS